MTLRTRILIPPVLLLAFVSMAAGAVYATSDRRPKYCQVEVAPNGWAPLPAGEHRRGERCFPTGD